MIAKNDFRTFIIARFKFIYTRNSIFMPESNTVQRGGLLRSKQCVFYLMRTLTNFRIKTFVRKKHALYLMRNIFNVNTMYH